MCRTTGPRCARCSSGWLPSEKDAGAASTHSFTQAFVGSNGYITFGSGDSTFSETVPAFNNRPRISAFFDDLIGGGGVWVNNQLPGRFIVTYDRTQQFCCFGSRTLQIQLFQDGRIIYAYRGITPLDTGTIVGISSVIGGALVALFGGSRVQIAAWPRNDA